MATTVGTGKMVFGQSGNLDKHHVYFLLDVPINI